MDTAKLRNLCGQSYDWTVNLRRELHKVPELNFDLPKTRAIIRAALDELNIPYTDEGRWIIALIEGKGDGKTVGLRTDMDALPVTEPEGLPFRSEHEGRMHACGHDMHTAIQLGTARVLSGMRDRLNGSIKLFFEPAEEDEGGAQPMVQAGALENPHVDVCYGLHVMTRLPLGTVETRPGTLNASTDEVLIDVCGVSGHAAYPETGRDAIVCAAQLITALQTVASRNVSPLESAVLSFGIISGGTAGNVICDRVRLRGTLRTADAHLRAFCKDRIREICAGVTAAYGCTADVTIIDGYAALVNHKRETELVLRTAKELLGEENVVLKDLPSMGGEDFSYFIEDTPGAFYHIGVTKPEDLPAPSLHSADFHAEEEGMLIGMMMQTALCLKETGTEL